MKYRVVCQAENGEIIHSYYVEAKNQMDAGFKNHQHPDYDKAAMKAIEKGVTEFQYVIDPITNLN